MNVNESQLNIRQAPISFFALLLHAIGASSLIAAPSIMILPVPVLAACISITVSAVVFVRKAMKSHPRLIKRFGEMLAIDTQKLINNEDTPETFKIGEDKISDVVNSETRVIKVQKPFSVLNLFSKLRIESADERLPLLDASRTKQVSLGSILEDDSENALITIGNEVRGGTSNENENNRVIRVQKIPTRIDNYFPPSDKEEDNLRSDHTRNERFVRRKQYDSVDDVRVQKFSSKPTNFTDTGTENERMEDGQSIVEEYPHPSSHGDARNTEQSNQESTDAALSVMDEILSDVVRSPSETSSEQIQSRFEAYRLPPLPIGESLHEPYLDGSGHDSDFSEPSSRNESLTSVKSSADSLTFATGLKIGYEEEKSFHTEEKKFEEKGHSIYDTVLNMNQEQEDIESMLLEGSAAHRERLHTQKSVLLEPRVSSEQNSLKSQTRTSEVDGVMSEIPLHASEENAQAQIIAESQKEKQTTYPESLYSDSSEAAFNSDHYEIRTPERTVTLDYFLTPQPRPFEPSERLDKYKLPPASASVDGHYRREPSAMDRMYGRSFAVPTLDFEPELYSPRRRRNRRAIPRQTSVSRSRSLNASPDEISRRERLNRSPSPSMQPPTALSSRLMPLPSLLDEEEKNDDKVQEKGSPARSADGALEPLLLREAQVEEIAQPSRRNSVARQRSVFSEIAHKRKYLERRAKSFARKAGFTRQTPPRPDRGRDSGN